MLSLAGLLRCSALLDGAARQLALLDTSTPQKTKAGILAIYCSSWALLRYRSVDELSCAAAEVQILHHKPCWWRIANQPQKLQHVSCSAAATVQTPSTRNEDTA